MTVPAAIRLETLSGAAVMDVVADLARLRVEVFRDFPYLYDGDAVYEERYLAKYARIADATIVVARDGARVVGAATALPLVAAEEEMQAPFAAGGMDPRDWYYFGESVLERAWRGRGIGVLRRRAPCRPSAASAWLCPARRILGPARLCPAAGTARQLRLAGHRPADRDTASHGVLDARGLTVAATWACRGQAPGFRVPRSTIARIAS
jgi:hypothetical protein